MEIKVCFLIPFIVLLILWVIAFFVRKSEYKRSRSDQWFFDSEHKYMFPELVLFLTCAAFVTYFIYMCVEVIDWQSSIYINI